MTPFYYCFWVRKVWQLFLMLNFCWFRKCISYKKKPVDRFFHNQQFNGDTSVQKMQLSGLHMISVNRTSDTFPRYLWCKFGFLLTNRHSRLICQWSIWSYTQLTTSYEQICDQLHQFRNIFLGNPYYSTFSEYIRFEFVDISGLIQYKYTVLPV